MNKYYFKPGEGVLENPYRIDDDMVEHEGRGPEHDRHVAERRPEPARLLALVKHDHDSVHRAVAIRPYPAYTYYMKDGEQVQCDKEKFFALPDEVRENGVIEEAAVLAIERSLVPHPGGMTPKAAWLFAFSKVCTSITSGWFRQYAYEHAPAILKRYPEGYWERFCKEMNHE